MFKSKYFPTKRSNINGTYTILDSIILVLPGIKTKPIHPVLFKYWMYQYSHFFIFPSSILRQYDKAKPGFYKVFLFFKLNHLKESKRHMKGLTIWMHCTCFNIYMEYGFTTICQKPYQMDILQFHTWFSQKCKNLAPPLSVFSNKKHELFM